MRTSRILLLLLVISLALPTAFFDAAPRAVPIEPPAHALASSSAPAPPSAELPLLKRDGKQKKRAKTTRHDRERKAKPDRTAPAPRLPESKKTRSDAKAKPPWKRSAADREEKCDGPGMVLLPRSGLCTHGPDPIPPGTDVSRAARPLSPSGARTRAARTVCDGDGVSGARVQVIYAHASNVPSKYNAYLESFRAWAADADTVMQESAAQVGGSRHIRFVTESCVIDVDHVTLSSTGDDSFDKMVVELQALGYDQTNRKYLIFIDIPATSYCGLGNLWQDDNPSQANWNNYGPSYTQVVAPCWSGLTAPHELMHTLGGVQDSAPNSSRGGHCIDEWDVMCYKDSPFYPDMRIDCPGSELPYRFDCNHNDYFHPSPPDGSYLDLHWNTANSRFLIGGGNGGDSGSPPTISWVAPVRDGNTHEVFAGTVALEATASDDSGVNRVRFLRYDAIGEEWFVLGNDQSAPYTASLAVSDLNAGLNYIAAYAYDGPLNNSSTGIWIERVAPPPPVRITTPKNGAKVKSKKSVSIAAQVSTALSAVTAVEFRSCPGGSCSWNTATPLATDSSAPFAAPWKAPKSGSATFLAQVTHAEGTDLSDPVRVTVKKAKKKKKH
jgi:hypothetical protein